MSGLIRSFDSSITASPKTRGRKDTSETCRERASADLLKSVTMFTANERLILERSAASWNSRARLLEGLEQTTAEKSLSASPASGEGADHVRL
jgi:hypothetical protein